MALCGFLDDGTIFSIISGCLGLLVAYLGPAEAAFSDLREPSPFYDYITLVFVVFLPSGKGGKVREEIAPYIALFLVSSPVPPVELSSRTKFSLLDIELMAPPPPTSVILYR